MAKTHFKTIIIIWLSSIIILGCTSKSKAQEKWTADMELTTYNGGGMVPESKTVTIKASSCSYIHWQMPKEDTLTFLLSQQELDALLKEMNTLHFQNMTSSDKGTITYDKPTTSIEFKSAKKIQTVRDGATESVDGSNTSKFFDLYRHILALAEKKTGQANKEN
ncbi:MAG: hypothetical protein LH619_01000 [Chitinophagaceae bacterium]|nr:hypothetical protein [Chitinophagaceae bacterium]